MGEDLASEAAQGEDGTFEPGSVNDRVDKEIQRLARVAKDAGDDKEAKKD